jgi:hypothetical protein
VAIASVLVWSRIVGLTVSRGIALGKASTDCLFPKQPGAVVEKICPAEDLETQVSFNP